MAQPDSKKVFFENLTGAGKAIAVLTSGGDAQGTGRRVTTRTVLHAPRPGDIDPVSPQGPRRGQSDAS